MLRADQSSWLQRVLPGSSLFSILTCTPILYETKEGVEGVDVRRGSTALPRLPMVAWPGSELGFEILALRGFM